MAFLIYNYITGGGKFTIFCCHVGVNKSLKFFFMMPDIVQGGEKYGFI